MGYYVRLSPQGINVNNFADQEFTLVIFIIFQEKSNDLEFFFYLVDNE